MASDIKVSVAIPVYNVAPYLPRWRASIEAWLTFWIGTASMCRTNAVYENCGGM